MDGEEDTYIKFGTALDPLDEGDMPSKKPINVEDQIVTDENGKRRFHGAFTGGFSAGFWNTVGSLEGWKPQEFKSSRQEKASLKRQRVEDFMDDEDLGEFGIAPQRVQAKDDFTNQSQLNKQRNKVKPADGPISGSAVLQTLLQPARDNVGVRLLKKMGWKEGQGIGARVTKTEKKKAKSRNDQELYIMEKYGCDLRSLGQGAESEDEGDSSDTEITFAPDDFDPFVVQMKINLFGLGYSGLDRNPVLLQRFSLFQPLEVLDKNNKKLSIAGQAFGVGAFEEEDDDIYAKDDLTKYDFSLDKRKPKKPPTLAIEAGFQGIEGFQLPRDAQKTKHRNKVFKVTMPDNFQPRNWTERRTRFDRISEDLERDLKETYKAKGLGRHDLNPNERSSLLNDAQPGGSRSADPIPGEPTEKTPRQKFLEMLNKKYENFEKSSSEIINDEQGIEQKSKKGALKLTETMSQGDSKQFKPFIFDSAKQKRYEQFINLRSFNDTEIVAFLATIQPIELSEWDREMEKKEFVQASKLYRPLDGLMSDRFVSESEVKYVEKKKEEERINNDNKEVQMKRSKSMWKPSSTLCKRFNVPEPFGGSMVEEKPQKKTKFSVFDYLETSVNRKDNFVTPIMIPPKSADQTAERNKALQKEKETMDKHCDTKGVSVKETLETDKKSNSTPIPDKKPSISELKSKQLKPSVKTELEQRAIDTKDKHPAEKKDLFKAIFESSESEDEENKEEAIKPPEKPDMSKILKKSATEINILRNNSPPRGIFANLFKKPEESKVVEKVTAEVKEIEKEVTVERPASSSEPKIVFRKKEERLKEAIDSGDMFGPRPPPPAFNPLEVSTHKREDEKLDNALEKLLLKGSGLKVVEKWVEKDKIKKRKHKDKKSKKHKKDKKKAKKKDKNKD